MDNDTTLGRIKRRTFMLVGGFAAALAAVGAAAFAVMAGHRRDRNKQSSVDLHQYDLSHLPPVDPAMIHYERTATLAAGFGQANDMTIGPDGSIYIAGGSGIVQLHADGSRRSDLPLAQTPQCVAVDEQGLLLIGMKDHVEVHEAGGGRTASWAVVDGQPYITSIAISGDHVFVADAGNRIVLHYDVSGKLLGRIGGNDPDADGPRFVIPSPYFDVRIGPAGRLWVANTGNHRLESYDFDGLPQASWGRVSLAIDGFCGCCNPCRFNVLADGRFLTSEKGLPRVKIYTADGALQSVVADPAALGVTTANFSCGVSAPAFAPPIVAADRDGRILLLHPRTGELDVYTAIQQAEGSPDHDKES